MKCVVNRKNVYRFYFVIFFSLFNQNVVEYINELTSTSMIKLGVRIKKPRKEKLKNLHLDPSLTLNGHCSLLPFLYLHFHMLLFSFQLNTPRVLLKTVIRSHTRIKY